MRFIFLYIFYSTFTLFAYTHKIDIYITDDKSNVVQTVSKSSSFLYIHSTAFFCSSIPATKFSRFFVQISFFGKSVILEKYSGWSTVTEKSCFSIRDKMKISRDIFDKNGKYQISVTFEEYTDKNRVNIQRVSSSIDIDVYNTFF